MEQQNWEAFWYGVSSLLVFMEKIITLTPTYVWGMLGFVTILGAIHTRLAR
jgi:hypothetical protein